MEFAVQSLEECEVLKLNCGSKPFTEAKFTSFTRQPLPHLTSPAFPVSENLAKCILLLVNGLCKLKKTFCVTGCMWAK